MPDLALTLNGEARAIPAGTTIGALVAQYNLSPQAILVERNGEALPRSEWPARAVIEGDRIEFIRVVAGG